MVWGDYSKNYSLVLFYLIKEKELAIASSGGVVRTVLGLVGQNLCPKERGSGADPPDVFFRHHGESPHPMVMV